MWTSTSASLEVQYYGMVRRTSEYKFDRADLTPAQLTALDQIRLIETPTRSPIPDAGSFLLRVVDQDGSIRNYLSAPENATPESRFGLEQGSTYSTIDFETLNPFIKTLP